MNVSIKPVSRFVKRVFEKYKEAYKRGEDKPAVHRARQRIKHGAGE